MGDIKRSNSFRSVTDELNFDKIAEVSLDGRARFYPGSTALFKGVDLDFCNGDNKDFGKGFYLSATEEFSQWYFDKGAKSANSGVDIDVDKYYLYQCLVDTAVEKLPNYLNLTNNLKALAKVCYIGRFHCTDKKDLLKDYDAILGWMVDDLNFDSIRNRLVTLGLLTRKPHNKKWIYEGKDANELLDSELDSLLEIMFMNDKDGAYQLAIKNKLIAENTRYVNLQEPNVVPIGGINV